MKRCEPESAQSNVYRPLLANHFLDEAHEEFDLMLAILNVAGDGYRFLITKSFTSQTANVLYTRATCV